MPSRTSYVFFHILTVKMTGISIITKCTVIGSGMPVHTDKHIWDTMHCAQGTELMKLHRKELPVSRTRDLYPLRLCHKTAKSSMGKQTENSTSYA